MRDAPPSWGGLPDQPGNGRLPDLIWTLASEVQPRPIRWVEKPFLLDSTFHLLVGKKAAGKGLWLTHTAARISRGELGPKTGVLWLSMSEDSYAVDIVPRLIVANAELAEVCFLANGLIRLPEQMQLLEERILPHIGLVVIDPLAGVMGSGLSSNNDTDIRPLLQGLNQMADRKQVMVVGIRHISIKAGGDEALASVLGSTAWVDVPRMVLGLFRDDVSTDLRHLFVLAGNRTPSEPTGAMFHVGGMPLDGHEEEVPTATLLGTSMKDPNELLSARGPNSSRTREAEDLVIKTLAEQPGEATYSDIIDTRLAQETGLAAQTIRNLRVKMGSKGTGLLRAWRERPDDKTSPWIVGLSESGRALARERGWMEDHSAPLIPSPSTPPLGLSDTQRESYSAGRDLIQESETEAVSGTPGSAVSKDLESQQVPLDAPDWEKNFWQGKE